MEQHLSRQDSSAEAGINTTKFERWRTSLLYSYFSYN
ncbi:hypothetical protein BVRB_8g200150 [Beta vulgaris subsp. vulgaris]|uniref:Uncharacterized protein n=1 Tax=Beta vulgaris subsp. vulgaris TaxID=3555 RepID=A0A7G2RMB3_BETVV|nr:hypothetical protein BVRB_8g200150 [Beta vulgaris subsp. vulgaris]